MLVTLAVKGSFALILTVLASWLPGATGYRFYGTSSGDAASYLDPAENLLSRGEYADSRGVRAGRMPGYPLTYLPFRAALGPEAGKTALAVTQVVLSGVSAYYLALTAFLLVGRLAVFYVALALYGLNLFVSMYDTSIQTESLVATAVIFVFYPLARFRTSPRRRYLVAAGCSFAYAVFLRPNAAALLVSAVLMLWLPADDLRRRLKILFRRLALLCLPFIVAESAWIARNFVTLNRFIPAQVNVLAGYPYTPSELALFGWLKAIGHEILHWNPNTMASWFHRDRRFTNENYAIPEYVLTSTCSLADIRQARADFQRADPDLEPSAAARQPAETAVVQTLDRCAQSFKDEKPVHYYVLSPLRIAKRLLVHAGPVLPLPAFGQIRHRPDLVMFKLGGAALYWLALLGGLVGVLWSAASRRPELWAIAFPAAFTILFLSFGLRHSESRLLVVAFPSLCLLAGIMLARTGQAIASARWLLRVLPLARSRNSHG